MRNAPAGTQVVIRAIRLLKSFTPDHPTWSLADLCAERGLSKSTVHRLLGALESEGLVTRDGGSGDGNLYRLGPAAVALGSQALRSDHLRTLARPRLEQLAAESDETATLEVPIDDQLLILDEVEGHHLIAANAEIGTRWPMHATSTGKAFLAALPAAQRDHILSSPLERFTPSTRIDAAQLAQDLAEVSRTGFATSWEELEIGHVAAGAALIDANGAPVGALSVGGPSSRIELPQLQRLGRLLAQHAQQLSRQLGWVG